MWNLKHVSGELSLLILEDNFQECLCMAYELANKTREVRFRWTTYILWRSGEYHAPERIFTIPESNYDKLPVPWEDIAHCADESWVQVYANRKFTIYQSNVGYVLYNGEIK